MSLQGAASLDAYVEGLGEFVLSSPSSYHAAHEVARQLVAAGFTLLDERDAWVAPSEGTGSVVLRDGAVVAWRAGRDVGPLSPVRVLGSHTDSPSFKLKPQPAFARDGWAQAGVEVYGGPLLNSWLDRDLEFAGRVVTTDGREVLARTGPVARIPQLAIHLDRQANIALELDKQKHLQPVVGVGLPEGSGDPLALLAESAGLERNEIAGYDIVLADTQAPERLGVDRGLFASGRLDNLSSVYASLVALRDTVPAPGTLSVLIAFDHEELGSASRSGAAGPFLEDVLGRIYATLGATGQDQARAYAESWCLSSDAGHSVHPNYSELHDPHVRPLAGKGPMLKVNAHQRYASDAHGAAMWRACCEHAGIETQTFVSNNSVPCGTTIGPLTATRLGLRTLDVGVPLLSMHSARELAHVQDLHGLTRAIGAFFSAA